MLSWHQKWTFQVVDQLVKSCHYVWERLTWNEGVTILCNEFQREVKCKSQAWFCNQCFTNTVKFARVYIIFWIVDLPTVGVFPNDKIFPYFSPLPICYTLTSAFIATFVFLSIPSPQAPWHLVHSCLKELPGPSHSTLCHAYSTSNRLL